MMIKTRILDAALRLHAAEGLEALSMRRLAQEVGMSPMGLYRHYPSKEDLLTAMVARGFERFRGAVSRLPMSLAGSPLARLRARWDRALAFAIREPELFELMFLTRGLSVRRFPEDFEDGSSPTFPLFVADVDSAMEAGHLRKDDPSEVAFLIWTQFHGLLAFHLRGRLGGPPSAVKRRFHDHLSRLLRGLALSGNTP